MNGCGKLIGSALSIAIVVAAHADAIFDIWIEAPEQVNAGDAFTASVWGEVNGSVLNNGDGAMRSVNGDLIATGVDVEFSSADIPYMASFSEGTPEPNALRGVLGYNDYYLPGFIIWTQNPIMLFEVEVTTFAASTGQLDLSFTPTANWESMLTWWVDWLDAEYIFDTDPGSSRVITPATVRVVPGQGGVAVLAVAGLAAARRRR